MRPAGGSTGAFSSVLVANRGEIACRIIRSARALGYRTVAVYSDADAEALHVQMADVATRLGEASVQSSYLAIDRIIAAAQRTGADAVHPGYGLLSENAAFARACAQAGLVFIGPPAEAIHLMGNKALAKRLMAKAQVPIIPGWNGDEEQGEQPLPDLPTLARAAERVGYPLLIKAAAGGGGRGMRLVSSQAELEAGVQAARAEAISAFGNGQLLLERALVGARHVEIQILADAHGNVVHLGERDCSVQRRHQKIIEEAPSPAVDASLRARMGAAAVTAAATVGYIGAGTVEFLLDASGDFYFLEMNTRIQVEHPVTEMITGLDLVALQLRVAAGEPLPFSQDQVSLRGHAIEARLYAEDPYAGFVPQTGRLLRFVPGVSGSEAGRVTDGKRVDHGLRSGQEITGWYDPLLAKLIAWGETRDVARRKLLGLLADTLILGVTTNKTFLTEVLAHPAFAAGQATTSFIADHLCQPGASAPTRPAAPAWITAIAAVLLSLPAERDVAAPIFFSSGQAGWPLRLEDTLGAARPLWVQVVGAGCYQVSVDAGESVQLTFFPGDGVGDVRLVTGDVQRSVHCSRANGRLFLDADGSVYAYREATERAAGKAKASLDDVGRVLAPMNGRLVSVDVAPGDPVARGQVVAVVEAMKMLCPITAPLGGRVSEVLVRAQAQVLARQLLLQITPGATPA
ncbi:MAG: geranyl-CoA carboxylase alpha subunit [Myxococcales bacterium]|nr:geranyl-CoA carboxylase alpha subunit [Myxococcales bacterium]